MFLRQVGISATDVSSIARNRNSSTDLTPSVLIRTGAKLRLESSIDVTPSVLIHTRSWFGLQLVKQDSVLALLNIDIGRTESGADDKSPKWINICGKKMPTQKTCYECIFECIFERVENQSNRCPRS